MVEGIYSLVEKILGPKDYGQAPAAATEDTVVSSEAELAQLEKESKASPMFWRLANPHNYAAWGNRFIRYSVYGGAFVVDPSSGENKVVSEGMAFGLLLAVQNNDYKLFNALLYSLEQDQMQKGLPAWRGHLVKKTVNEQEGYVFELGPKDPNSPDAQNPAASATDADLDIALALIQAYQKAKDGEYGWRVAEKRYKKLAQRMLDLIWRLDVVDGGKFTLLKGSSADAGPQAGIGARINPSYFSFAAFEVFHDFDQDFSHRWLALKSDCYNIMNLIINKKIWRAGTIGKKREEISLSEQKEFIQIPDWVAVWYQDGRYHISALSGEIKGKGGRYTSFQGYDAVRFFWRLAQDALWYRDQRAIFLARKLIDQLENKGVHSPEDIPIYSMGLKAYEPGPKMIVLATYAALAKAAATPMPKEAVPEKYIRWRNKTANLFLRTYQTVGDENGAYFLDVAKGGGSNYYYDQTTALIVSLILGESFKKEFKGVRGEWSRDARKIIGDCDSWLNLHFVCFPRVMTDPSERQKLSGIVARYLGLEGEDPSTRINIRKRLLLARELNSFGKTKEAIEQYRILLLHGDFSRDYKVLLNAYVEVRGLIEQNLSTLAGVRIFEEIKKSNPTNLFAWLGVAQFRRNMYSRGGYEEAIKLCDELLKKVPLSAPDILGELYRIKAEAYFGLFLLAAREGVLNKEEGENKEVAQAAQAEGLELTLEELENLAWENCRKAKFKPFPTRKTLGKVPMRKGFVEEGHFMLEAELHIAKAEQWFMWRRDRNFLKRVQGGADTLEGVKKEDKTEHLKAAKAEYEKALKIYVRQLERNNYLAGKASLTQKDAYRNVARNILLRILDLYAKLGETEYLLMLAEKKEGPNLWREKGKSLAAYLFWPYGEKLNFSAADGAAQIKKAFELVQDLWKESIIMPVKEEKRKRIYYRWQRDLQTRKIQLAKLASLTELQKEIKIFLTRFTPTGNLRVYFDKVQYYLQMGDRYHALEESQQTIQTLKLVLACLKGGKAKECSTFSPKTNRFLRTTLDLIHDGQLKKARAKTERMLRLYDAAVDSLVTLGRIDEAYLSLADFGLSLQEVKTILSWGETDLEFLGELEKVLPKRDISPLDELLSRTMEKDEMLRTFFTGGKKPGAKTQRKIRFAIVEMEKVQAKIYAGQPEQAQELIGKALEKLEKGYGEPPYDPQWVDDFIGMYWSLVWVAKEHSLMGLVRKHLLGVYKEMIGHSFWTQDKGEEISMDMYEDNKYSDKDHKVAVMCKEILPQIRAVLRDEGIHNLLLTAFAQRGYLKRDVFVSIGGFMYTPEDWAIREEAYRKALALDPENIELQRIVERMEREKKTQKVKGEARENEEQTGEKGYEKW